MTHTHTQHTHARAHTHTHTGKGAGAQQLAILEAILYMDGYGLEDVDWRGMCGSGGAEPAGVCAVSPVPGTEVKNTDALTSTQKRKNTRVQQYKYGGEPVGGRAVSPVPGTQFTSCAGTIVQILTPEGLTDLGLLSETHPHASTVCGGVGGVSHAGGSELDVVGGYVGESSGGRQVRKVRELSESLEQCVVAMVASTLSLHLCRCSLALLALLVQVCVLTSTNAQILTPEELRSARRR